MPYASSVLPPCGTGLLTAPVAGAVEQAFEMAGLVSGDVDVAVVDDSVTRIESISYEEAFAERLGGRKLVETAIREGLTRHGD